MDESRELLALRETRDMQLEEWAHEMALRWKQQRYARMVANYLEWYIFD